MRSFTDAIDPPGPLVPIEVTFPTAVLQSYRAAGRPIPPPVTMIALIDTGSDVTVIDSAVLAPLVAGGLPLTRMFYVNAPGAGGLAPAIEYRVGLTIAPRAGVPRSGLALPTHPVYERPLGLLGYQALIGRDVLAHGGLFYDGAGGRFTLVS